MAVASAFIRIRFAAFHQVDVETTYTISSAAGSGKRVGELLISNFPLPG
ncbi:hypothetical protein H5J25_13950 [Sphingomonas aliaeris]|uniref:Uncharacterized protein n=1 Tax=Sphingomonas aliaeris TaxID=2759526 RepID=A0A974NTC0_9SPHN|nr:hypothetical protein [Sphingomonas aliaeris]QQV76545.1 hypothetical protein H5J25_13950 [Sphingomonas aliaeris]